MLSIRSVMNIQLQCEEIKKRSVFSCDFLLCFLCLMTCDAYVCVCLLYGRKSRLDPWSASVAHQKYIHFVLVPSFFYQRCRFPAATPAIISFDTNTNLCREKKMYSHTCSQLTHTDLKIYATLHSQQHKAVLVVLDTNAPFFQHGVTLKKAKPSLGQSFSAGGKGRRPKDASLPGPPRWAAASNRWQERINKSQQTGISRCVSSCSKVLGSLMVLPCIVFAQQLRPFFFLEAIQKGGEKKKNIGI